MQILDGLAEGLFGSEIFHILQLISDYIFSGSLLRAGGYLKNRKGTPAIPKVEIWTFE